MNIESILNNPKIKTWHKIIIALFSSIGTAYVLVWHILEPISEEVIEKIYFLYTLSLLVGLILSLFLLWKFELLPKSKRNYCSVSYVFKKEYKNFIAPLNENDQSNLWYVFINTRKFDETKKNIVDYFSPEHKNRAGILSKNIHVWSLLGGSELLLKYRAHEKDGQSIFDGLKELLKENNLLETSTKNQDGIILINCAQERFRISSSLKRGKVSFTTIPTHYRHTKIFIKFQFDNNTLITSITEKITTILNEKEYNPFTEVFSYTGKNSSVQFAVIELIFPCGYKHVLNELSKELAKDCLDEGLTKETYMGYEMELINL